jgi:hypothetical protein
VDFPGLFAEFPPALWAALSGGASGIGAWFVGMRQISASIERERLKVRAEAQTDENAERAAFRTALIADISDLRQLMKECEVDRDLLRTRVNSAEEQIIVLKASNEIMDRWLSFFKDRNALDSHLVSGGSYDEESIGRR